MRRVLSPFMLAAALASQTLPDDPVDDELLLERIEANCKELRAAGSLRSVADLRADADGRRCALQFAPPRTTPLPPPELRALLLRSTLVVGHYYLCDECHDWHFSACTGFALAREGIVATCYHLLADDPGMPQACLLVADWQGRVWPVTAVLAGDRAADVAILRCTAKDLTPLPLRPDARAGERIFCLSNPDHQFACFSEGLIARRYVVRGVAPGTEGDAGAPSEPAHGKKPPADARAIPFLQVTCDFAVGSSGAPITDACGNVVGVAQSTATVLADPDATPAETQMVVRTAAPANALRALVKE